MAGPKFRFLACDALSNARLGYLDLQEVTFNDPVTGVGQLTGKAYISPSQDRDKLDTLTAVDDVALYVQTPGVYWWGGPIKARPWNADSRCREISAMHWKGWLGQRIIGPNPATNPVTDTTYSYLSTDQLTTAQTIIGLAATGAGGTPQIRTSGETSGITRDLKWLGSDFRYAADLIDSMATRDRGFDWTITILPDNLTGLPTLYFAPYYPARGAQAPALVFKRTPNGGNISVEGSIADSSTDRRTRVWTTGKGSPPDRKMAYDQDPDVAADTTLLTETVTGYTSVDDVTTLATSARAERVFRAVPTNTMQVRALFADLDPTRYGTGDRAQLLYSDEGIDISLTAVRIIDRVLNLYGTGADYALLTLDLADAALPDNTTDV